MSWSADQAKRVALTNAKGPVIEPYIKEIDKSIDAAAREGKMHINMIYKNYVPHGSMEHVQNHYRGLGYVVKHHEDADPGDMRGPGAYDSLHWG